MMGIANVMSEIKNINNSTKRDDNTNDNTEIVDNIKWNGPKMSTSITLCEKMLDDCARMVNHNDKILETDLVSHLTTKIVINRQLH